MNKLHFNPKYFIWLLVAVVLGAIIFGIWSVVDDVKNNDKFNPPVNTAVLTPLQ